MKGCPAWPAAAVELVEPRGDSESAMTVARFVDQYVAKRVDVKPRTAHLLKETVSSLKTAMGARPLDSITPGDADDWRLMLVGKGLGDNTIRRRCGRAKQFFRAAVRKGLIDSNRSAT